MEKSAVPTFTATTNNRVKHFDHSSSFFIITTGNAQIVKRVRVIVRIDCKACGCNETNLMHSLLSVYSVPIPLHVSGLAESTKHVEI
jgi:hypothetical protein